MLFNIYKYMINVIILYFLHIYHIINKNQRAYIYKIHVRIIPLPLLQMYEVSNHNELLNNRVTSLPSFYIFVGFMRSQAIMTSLTIM